MAKPDKPALSTCPICGYSDNSTDPQALALDIQAHMRSVHNLEPSSELLSESVKTGTPAGSNSPSTDPPSAGIVGNLGNSSSGSMAEPNIGHTGPKNSPGDPRTQARNPLDKSDSDHF